MFKRYIIGLDEGTTSARAVIYDTKTNKIVAIAVENFKQTYPVDGWVEQNAEEIYLALVFCVKKAMSEAGINYDEVISVGLTNQRETIVAWDRKTGKPIYNAIVWQCRRTAQAINKLSEEQKQIIKAKTGLVADPYFSASKMQWILKNVPMAKELLKDNNLCFGTIDTYIAYKLTGEFVTDTSNASRTMLFNINTLEWDNELLKMWGVQKECLPKVVSSSERVGYIQEMGNVPLSSILGDQQASLIGNGCLNQGDAKITYGTGGFMLINAGETFKYKTDKLLSTIAYTIKGKTTYAIEGSIFSACSAINWLKYGLKMIDTVEETEKIAFSEDNNGGVYFVPAFTGLGSPYWKPNTRGAFVGINYSTNRNHMIRAVLESFGYGTAAISREAEKSGIKLKTIKADGGGSKNNFILQFLADMLGIDVNRSESSECTVLGAIYFAGIAEGVWTIEDIKNLTKIKKVFVPVITKKEREKLYADWEKAVERSDW